MKIIATTIFPLFIAIALVACNSVASTSTPDPFDASESAIAIAETWIAMTQTAIPSATATNRPIVTRPPFSTIAPPTPTKIPPDTYADKIDYAMTVAPTIYNKLPFISKVNPYGEYSGCIHTYDFHNFVGYPVLQSMEAVNNAFLNYFSAEKWEFKEPNSEIISWNGKSATKTTYDVYRITSKVMPSFERLRVILTDQSAVRGDDYVEVRAELTHVETKENLEYLLDPLACYAREEYWLWIRLHK